MPSNARAYAMIMWNQYNDSGKAKTKFISTDIGLDEDAWRTLEHEGVITDFNTVDGGVEFHPIIALNYLKLN